MTIWSLSPDADGKFLVRSDTAFWGVRVGQAEIRVEAAADCLTQAEEQDGGRQPAGGHRLPVLKAPMSQSSHRSTSSFLASRQVAVGGALIAAARNVIAQRRASPAAGDWVAEGGWL
jgi:hypothetical protein